MPLERVTVLILPGAVRGWGLSICAKWKGLSGYLSRVRRVGHRTASISMVGEAGKVKLDFVEAINSKE